MIHYPFMSNIIANAHIIANARIVSQADSLGWYISRLQRFLKYDNIWILCYLLCNDFL
jgi:hypothetical protein